MPDSYPHELVTASAGFGKTHRLTSRLLALIASPLPGGPVPINRLAALTFSRAAAGEIFDTLVTRLAIAASSSEAAAKEVAENREITSPAPDVEHFQSALARLLGEMNTTFIGTIDSFFVRTLRAFSPELGLPASFTIAEASDYRQARRHLLHELLSNAGQHPQARARLAELLKQATHGHETKRIIDTIDTLSDRLHGLFLRVPDAGRWGDPATIFGASAVRWLSTPRPLAETVPNLENALDKEELTAAQRAKWDELITLAHGFTPVTRTAVPSTSMLPKLLANHESLSRGDTQITLARKKIVLSPTTCRHTLDLLHHILHCELRNRVAATQALHGLLFEYEQLYHQRLRCAGILTHADVPCLLAGRALHALTDWPPDGALPELQYLNYRLDGTLDHWALDEFQDTSRGQWALLEDLLEEILFAAPPERTFFAVGDPKQAIYSWRGGDVHLMKELRTRFSTGTNPSLTCSALGFSYRSGKAVLDTVNRVFGCPERWPEAVPESAKEQWADPAMWQEHHPAAEKPAYTALLELPRPKGASKAELAEQRREATARLLHPLDSGEKNLSIAVLVRTNTEGRALTRHLRSAGLDARWDGDALIADNPVVETLLDALRAAAHPADTLAGRAIEMSPLAEVLPPSRSLLTSLARRGFRTTIERLADRLRSVHPLCAFAEFRLGQLLRAAGDFDAGGGEDPVEFIDFVEGFTVRDLPPRSGIRVMTMHRSKGLGFDAVVLPDLDFALDHLRSEGVSPVSAPDNPGEIAWLLDFPPRDFARVDPVLSEALEARRNRQVQEALCLLYVAMTRAKQGLYAITTAPPTSNRNPSLTAAAVLLAGLDHGGEGDTPPPPADLSAHRLVYSNGQPEWFRPAVSPTETTPNEPKPVLQPLPLRPTSRPQTDEPAAPGRALPRHPRRLPSAACLHTTPATTLFAKSATRAAEFGTLVHGLFEELEWWVPGGLKTAVARWRARFPAVPAAQLDAAETEVGACLTEAEVTNLLRRPAKTAELRREQAFELLLDQRWVSGVMDRVQLDREGGEARIIDFKTDRVSTPEAMHQAVERHTPQMQLYRRALARVTGLPEERIETVLLFTSLRRTAPVAP